MPALPTSLPHPVSLKKNPKTSHQDGKVPKKTLGCNFPLKPPSYAVLHTRERKATHRAKVSKAQVGHLRLEVSVSVNVRTCLKSDYIPCRTAYTVQCIRCCSFRTSDLVLFHAGAFTNCTAPRLERWDAGSEETFHCTL